MNCKSRERVLKAVKHIQPDRTPTDFQAVSEIWGRLYSHFKTNDIKDVIDKLNIDCVWVDPEVLRPYAEKDNEGLFIGWGGSKFKLVENEYGFHQEVVHYVLDGCETITEIDNALCLPDLNEYDFSVIGQTCQKFDDKFLLGGFASSFYYPTQVRNMEDLLVDLVINPGLAKHIIKRCFDWHMDYHERLLKAAAGRLDAMQIADDFATQLDLLISVEMFREYFKKPMSEYIALAKSYGAIPFFHCCGSAYHLIKEFIDIGIEILDPVQTAANNMDPEKLKTEFGTYITFHGAGETQHILPHGNCDEVRENARFLSKTLGSGGGYIMSSCHFFQSDVPVNNILAFYELENRI